jgi:predicted SAM-dependent methyltransferase
LLRKYVPVLPAAVLGVGPKSMETKKMNESKYIQYGCGWSAPSQWRNFDASPTLRFERIPLIGRLFTKNQSRFPNNIEYGDIVKGLPVEKDSCAGVYCSHILEHLSLSDFRVALGNTKDILRPAGIFRLVLPDLEYSISKYRENPLPDAAPEFMRETSLGHENRARGFKGIAITWFGNSRHLWMWDYKSIAAELQDAGFIEIRRASFGDSSDPFFITVENKDRWDTCLGVECKKPG